MDRVEADRAREEQRHNSRDDLGFSLGSSAYTLRSSLMRRGLGQREREREREREKIINL